MESNIRKLRKERAISQTELADVIGFSQQGISRIENDRNRIRVKTLIALADYFQVSTDTILGYGPDEKREREMEQAGRNWELEGAEHVAETKPIPASDNGQSAVYDLLVSMKRCLEKYGI